MKYKVGDKVRIKNGLKPDEYGVTPPMLGYCGEVMTVKSTYSILSAYYLVEDNAEFIWHEDTLEPADSKTLRMADGTIIGDFSTGGTVSIHDLPTTELIKKEFNVKWIEEEKKMPTKFTFYTVDTSRINKTNNTKVDTVMTCVHIGDKVGYATCDKEDYDEREGILNAIANLCCDGSFDKAYRKAVKEKKISETLDRTCSYCRKVFDTVEERQEHEAWHIECRKARRERYLLRKRAKEIAFEEQAQKMAKEMMGEQK